MKRIVLTGGPGAGKTAMLELIRKSFCEHVRVLPEAASIIFGGGFPRQQDLESRRASQRAIYYVQRELEVTADVHAPEIVICDRGTLDGLAYWPDGLGDFWTSLETTEAREYARYHAIIHMRTPGSASGYTHVNPLRIETPDAAAVIDARILDVWARHPRRFIVDATPDFMDKVARTFALVRAELPECCLAHQIAPAAQATAT